MINRVKVYNLLYLEWYVMKYAAPLVTLNRKVILFISSQQFPFNFFHLQNIPGLALCWCYI